MVQKNQKVPKAVQRDDPEQSQLFLKKAREVQADRKQSRANELIGHLAKKPPEPRKK